jgi:hypothetical protein
VILFGSAQHPSTLPLRDLNMTQGSPFERSSQYQSFQTFFALGHDRMLVREVWMLGLWMIERASMGMEM